MNWIEEIKLIQKKDGQSQFEEAEIIQHIFDHIGETNRFFVDLGAGAYDGKMSNTSDMKQNGWIGFGVDMNPTEDWMKKYFITPENVVAILRENFTPKEFDFLNLDIDSCDFWVLKNILEAGYRPRLICTEFNGTLDPEKSVVLSYEGGYTWDNTNKYGYSFSAGKKLLGRHGYDIVFNQHDTNLFAIQSKDLAQDPAVTAIQRHYHPTSKDATWEEYV